jgi:hypothetical protein
VSEVLRVEGPAAVSERDQFEAECADIIREAYLLYLVAAPLADGGPPIVIRSLVQLSDDFDSVERADGVRCFLEIARDGIDGALAELGEL